VTIYSRRELMPIPGAHIFGWDEAPTDEKLQALYDWCILLTDALRAAGEETQTLLARVKKLEGEASVRTGVSIAAPETHKEVANSNALEESSAPPTLSTPHPIPHLNGGAHACHGLDEDSIAVRSTMRPCW
jgi:hypothetical protein